jgi:surface protein
MNGVFGNCSKLTSLKWSNWCPQANVDLSTCSNLTSESLKDLLANLATVTGGQTLTLGSTNSAKVSTADILAAQLKGWKFDGDVSVAVVFASDTISGNDTVTECGIQLTESNKYTRIDEVMGAYTACNKIYLFEDGSVTTLQNLLHNYNTTYKSRITELALLSGYFGNVTSAFNMFRGCSGLVSADLKTWDVSKVTSMSSMFHGCGSLTSLDLSNWKLDELTAAREMFAYCGKLETLNLSGWSTPILNDITTFCFECTALTSVDMSGWNNTGKITSFGDVFRDCRALTSIDVSGWDTSSATSMLRMFQNCSKLTSLDVSNWDTSKVTNMGGMFDGCSKLTSLDVSNWDTSSVTNMVSMFNNCSSLTSLDISNWDTSSLTNIQTMFYGCSKLTSLDFTGWDMSKITTFAWLCYNCTSLESIIGLNLSSYSDFNGHQSTFLSFIGCDSLKTIKDIDVSFTVKMGSTYPNSVNIAQEYWVGIAWKWFKGLNNLEDITFKGQIGLWDTLSYYPMLNGCDTSKFTLETWESFVSIFPETPTPKSIGMGKSQANLDAVPYSIKTALINKGYTLTFVAN